MATTPRRIPIRPHRLGSGLPSRTVWQGVYRQDNGNSSAIGKMPATCRQWKPGMVLATIERYAARSSSTS
jgi:hypothetical protein